MKQLVVFTMQTCGHCQEFKGMLNENKIEFHDRDIFEHADEYKMFVKSKNDLVPAFMIFDDEDTTNSTLFAPNQDYKTLQEALDIVKENF